VPDGGVHAFLGSQGLGAFGPWLDELPRRPLTTTLVATASNRYTEAPWVGSVENVLTRLGLKVARLDLEGATATVVKERLKATDLVFVTGGHGLFLLEHAQRSGFSSIVPDAVRAGSLLYAGTSSGGFLAGPDLLHTADLNDPGVVSNSRGLGIVNFIPLSHANRGKEAEHRAIAARFEDRYTFVSITDEQAIIVSGDKWEVRPSPIVD
jgi:dipeptidase E